MSVNFAKLRGAKRYGEPKKGATRIPQGHELARKDSETPRKDPFTVSPGLGEGMEEEEQSGRKHDNQSDEKETPEKEPEQKSEPEEQGRPQHTNASQELADQEGDEGKKTEPEKSGADHEKDKLSSSNEQAEAAKALKESKLKSGPNGAGGSSGEAPQTTGKPTANPAGRTGGAGTRTATTKAATAGAGAGTTAGGVTIAGLSSLVKGDALGAGFAAANAWWLKVCFVAACDITGTVGIPAFLYLCFHKIAAKFAPKIFNPFVKWQKIMFWILAIWWILVIAILLLAIMAILGLIDWAWTELRLDEVVSLVQNPAGAATDLFWSFMYDPEAGTSSPFQFGGWTPFDWSD